MLDTTEMSRRITMRSGGFRQSNMQHRSHIGQTSDAQTNEIVRRAVQQSSNTAGRIAMVAIALAMAVAVGYGVWGGLLQRDVNRLENKVDANTATVTVYLDGTSGVDTNSGTVSTAPVKTLDRAITVMEQFSGLECIFSVTGIVDLGANPTVCFFPLITRCKHIRVVGAETVVGSGTIDAPITKIAPGGRNWDRITDTSAAFTPSAFVKAFIRNINQNRVYVVEDNAATTVDTIAGTVQLGPPPLPTPPMPVPSTEAWLNGQSFTVFTLATTITWTGDLVLDIPYNDVNVESIHFVPGSDQATLRSPDGPEHRVTFKGCQLDARSSDEFKPSYIGSMLLLGVYGEGTIAGAFFTSFQQGRCLISESLWVDQAAMFYTDVCQAVFLKSTASPDHGLILDNAANFRGLGIYIVEPMGNGIIISGGTAAIVNFLEVELTTGPGTVTVSVNAENSVVLGTMTLTCSGASCFTGILVFRGSNAQLSGPAIISAPQAFNLQPRSSMDIIGNPTLSGFTAGTTPIAATQQSKLNLEFASGWTIDLDTPGIVAPVVVCTGCSMAMSGAAASYIWSTPAGTPLITATNGATLLGRFSGTLINNGGVATEVVMCGGNAITDWAVAENDFALAAGTTQGVNCAR